MSSPEHYLGERLSFSSSACTVRYIGEVVGTTGTWLGVEWDDALRGKHSGEYNGTKYFSVRVPNSASFVRPTRKPDPKLTFVEAVFEKYAPSAPEDHAAIKFGTKVAEEVGFDKIRNKLADVRGLKAIMLDAMRVGSAGKESEIKDYCGDCRELGLAGNLFEELEEVAKIVGQLEKCTVLRLDANRFLNLSLSEASKTAFHNVENLELKAMFLTDTELPELLSHFPSLKHLDLSHNQLEHLPALPVPPNMREIDLRHNNISSLTAIATLAPGPTSLTLNHNKFTTLDPLPTPFSSTSRLSITYNFLPTPSSLDLIPALFPSLTALRLTHNPLFPSPPEISTPASEAEFKAARDLAQSLIISRLPRSVTELNFSKITEDERTQAELYYLSLIAREIADAGGDEEAEKAVTPRHKRWSELCALHGVPDIPSQTGGDGRNTLEAQLMKIVIKGEGGREEMFEVPKAMKVGRLFWMVGRKWGRTLGKWGFRCEDGSQSSWVGLDLSMRECGPVFGGVERVLLVNDS